MGLIQAEARRDSFQIDSLHALSKLVAVADEVSKVFSGDFGLRLELTRLLSLHLELFYISLKTNAHLIRWSFEYTADLRAYA